MSRSADFSRFVPEARAFLTRLAANNDRDWFKAHQKEYDATIRIPAQHLLAALEPRVAEIAGAPVRTKFFRPQRDTRFSADKTPYKDHTHVLWHAPSGTPVGYFLGVSPDYVRIGAGVMAFEGHALEVWRQFAEGAGGDGLSADLAGLEAGGFTLSEPELKRVPPPYPSDHPQAALLRRKSLTAFADAAADTGDLPETLLDVFRRLTVMTKPLAALF